MKRVLTLAATGTLACLLLRATVRRARAFHFRNKNVLITGGSRGLGLVLARRLVDYGARVAICGRDPHVLERARQEFLSRGEELATVVCDVGDQLAVEAAVKTVRDKFESIDVLINNAGTIQIGPEEETTLADYDAAMRVHFWGPLHMIRAVLPAMSARSSGRIINIASIGGLVSVPHLLPYCASKFALVGLSEGLRTELLKHGVYVTTVCPGLMRTGGTSHAEFKGQRQAEYTWFSVAASSPVISMSAEQAAEQILEASSEGRARLVLSWTAKVARAAHDLAPGITAEMLSLVDRILPGPGPTQGPAMPGRTSRPRWLPAFLTRAIDAAAQRNNEVQQSVQVGCETSSLSYSELDEPL